MSDRPHTFSSTSDPTLSSRLLRRSAVNSADPSMSVPDGQDRVPAFFSLQTLSIATLRSVGDLRTYSSTDKIGEGEISLIASTAPQSIMRRRIEKQSWKGFWPCSGRFEVVVPFGMLSLVAQFVYWSRIVSGFNQEHA